MALESSGTRCGVGKYAWAWWPICVCVCNCRKRMQYSQKDFRPIKFRWLEASWLNEAICNAKFILFQVNLMANATIKENEVSLKSSIRQSETIVYIEDWKIAALSILSQGWRPYMVHNFFFLLLKDLLLPSNVSSSTSKRAPSESKLTQCFPSSFPFSISFCLWSQFSKENSKPS